jgi:rod shape-determining protein MreD
MTLWLLIPFLLMVAVVQVTLIPLVAIAGFKVDLALIVVVAQALVGTPGTAAQWGFIVGVFLDLASGLPFGIHALVLTLVGLLMDLGQAAFFRDNVLAPPIAMIAATFFYNILILAILALFNRPVDWGGYLFRIILPSSILNTLAMPIAYFPLRWIHRRLRPQLEV